MAFTRSERLRLWMSQSSRESARSRSNLQTRRSFLSVVSSSVSKRERKSCQHLSSSETEADSPDGMCDDTIKGDSPSDVRGVVPKVTSGSLMPAMRSSISGMSFSLRDVIMGDSYSFSLSIVDSFFFSCPGFRFSVSWMPVNSVLRIGASVSKMAA